jgi:hypothetical protein
MRAILFGATISLGFACGATALAADGALEQSSVTQEAMDEARRLEQEALQQLYDAHERVKALSGEAPAPADPEKIVNGLLTSGFPTAGAFLKRDADGSFSSWCTGTLIGCRTFLTARHCVESDEQPGSAAQPGELDGYRVYLQHGGVFDVSAIATHPDYDFPLADLAVVTLATGVDGITPTALNRSAPIANATPATIVGFGRSGGTRTDYGLKRTGAVLTAACRDTASKLLCWNYDTAGAPGTASNTCNADSGGPLFADDASSTPVRTVLAGVTSGGTRADCLRRDHSYDVDVHEFADWIDQQTQDPLAPASCGNLPQWGADGVVTRSGSGLLDANKVQARHTLTVPAGGAKLRFAMNAEDSNGAIDFDLFVRRGSEPTATQADCRQTDASQYAFCEFANPQPGVWHLLVKRKKGAGIYQLVATWFED